MSVIKKFEHFMSQAADVCEHIIFSSRWLLLVPLLGTVLGLIVYLCKFLQDLAVMVWTSPWSTDEMVMVGLLGLVDTLMVSSLVSMVVQGGYQIFVRRIKIMDPASRPQMLEHMDSGILKVKNALSICGIMLIQILKDFLNDHVDWETSVHRCLYLGVVTAVTLVMAIIWRIMHPQHPGAQQPPQEPTGGTSH